MLKKVSLILFSSIVVMGVNVASYGEDDFIEEVVEESIDEQAQIADVVSTDALNNYVIEGSLFERITTLEQEKAVMQLEKERAQLDLELERLNAEKIKLQMELDTLSGRAEQQQYELENTKKQLEIQTEKLKRQRETIESDDEVVVEKTRAKSRETEITEKYRLINVVGVDNQLQATIEEITTGQNKRISVGKELDGYTVKSISLNDGVIFEKDGIKESLNIGK